VSGVNAAPTAHALTTRYESGVVPLRPLTIVRGEGCWLYDEQGRRYLDFGLNYGVGNVGHAHPKVVAAIQAQAARLTFAPGTVANDVRACYLERLASVAPPGLSRAFLANSGTEAVEAAIKFACGTAGRHELVAAKRGFHGRTLGALALNGTPAYRQTFEPLLSASTLVPFGDVEALKQAVTSNTAAVVLEPIQGEGGVHLPPDDYLRAARDLANDAGALLVFDEVQTGFGRTGAFWACQHDGVTPDILAFAKAAGGGLPLGGVLLAEHVRLAPKQHGSTFGGNPVACAAGLAVLDIIGEGRLVENAAHMGARLVTGLQEAAGDEARAVRGRGLMVALELRRRHGPVLAALQEAGVLALPTGATTLRFLPPLTVTADDVDVVVAATARAVADMSESAAATLAAR